MAARASILKYLAKRERCPSLGKFEFDRRDTVNGPWLEKFIFVTWTDICIGQHTVHITVGHSPETALRLLRIARRTDRHPRLSMDRPRTLCTHMPGMISHKRRLVSDMRRDESFCVAGEIRAFGSNLVRHSDERLTVQSRYSARACLTQVGTGTIPLTQYSKAGRRKKIVHVQSYIFLSDGSRMTGSRRSDRADTWQLERHLSMLAHKLRAWGWKLRSGRIFEPLSEVSADRQITFLAGQQCYSKIGESQQMSKIWLK